MNTSICTLSADEISLVAGGYNFGASSNTYVNEYLNINKSLTSVVCVVGNFAGAEAGATALGYGTATQAVSATATTPISSASSATSISATGGNYSYN